MTTPTVTETTTYAAADRDDFLPSAPPAPGPVPGGTRVRLLALAEQRPARRRPPAGGRSG